VDLDRGLVLAGIVHHLAHECRQPVDRETRPAVFFAAAPDRIGPLLGQPRETDVVERIGAVLLLALGALLEAFLGVLQDFSDFAHGTFALKRLSSAQLTVVLKPRVVLEPHHQRVAQNKPRERERMLGSNFCFDRYLPLF
jgi:hypothetical protein